MREHRQCLAGVITAAAWQSSAGGGVQPGLTDKPRASMSHCRTAPLQHPAAPLQLSTCLGLCVHTPQLPSSPQKPSSQQASKPSSPQGPQAPKACGPAPSWLTHQQPVEPSWMPGQGEYWTVPCWGSQNVFKKLRGCILQWASATLTGVLGFWVLRQLSCHHAVIRDEHRSLWKGPACVIECYFLAGSPPTWLFPCSVLTGLTQQQQQQQHTSSARVLPPCCVASCAGDPLPPASWTPAPRHRPTACAAHACTAAVDHPQARPF